MQISNFSFRSFAVAATLVAAGASAHALTIGTNALIANSVQAFSSDALGALALYDVTIAPLGNATEVVGADTASYSFPITTITVDNNLKITSGDAKGSALEIARVVNGTKIGLVLANFTINYTTKQVLADTTVLGGVTTPQEALYDFNVATPLALKYKFPLTITGHEVLDTLKVATPMKATMISALSLPVQLANIVLDATDFGTLTQDIVTKLRPKAVSNKPYVVK